MFEKLIEQGFQSEFTSHAKAILAGDFPEVAAELEEVLVRSTIPIQELIGSGGGEAKGTQRLRKALNEKGWHKHNFVVKRTIDDVEKESQSHEVDHVRTFENGTIALEIEWNNKDPFFDRDLENFKRLHADGAISVGVIVTRGAELQAALKQLVGQYAEQENIQSNDDMERIGLVRTPRQVAAVMKRVEHPQKPIPFREAWVDQFVNDKFGMATTHWAKLEDRVRRGVGNPCPLILIGLPPSIVTFEDGPNPLQKLLVEPD